MQEKSGSSRSSEDWLNKSSLEFSVTVVRRLRLVIDVPRQVRPVTIHLIIAHTRVYRSI